MILILQYQKGSQIKQEAIFTFYLENLTHINNWNLVDCSAHLILGAHLYTKHHDILYTFAQSDHLWTKRIAIIATLYFIRKASFETTLNLAKILLNDQHNLIHKAVGWMLREIGKKNEKVLQEFLQEHAPYMPRVMLAYAIEKLEPAMRKSYQAMKKIR
jgi:3-methyladenine DNA glycosylase AlkD